MSLGHSDTNTKCPLNISPPNISPPKYKPPKKCLRMFMSPGLIFGILRYFQKFSKYFALSDIISCLTFVVSFFV